MIAHNPQEIIHVLLRSRLHRRYGKQLDKHPANVRRKLLEKWTHHFRIYYLFISINDQDPFSLSVLKTEIAGGGKIVAPRKVQYLSTEAFCNGRSLIR